MARMAKQANCLYPKTPLMIVFFLYFGTILPVFYSISRNSSHCCSPLCPARTADGSSCRWTAVPCTRAVRRPVLSAVSRGEKWRRMNIVAWQRGGTPVVSILVVQSCATPCGAAECSWFGTFWGWTVADTLRRSCLSEATLLQLDTSSGRVAGRQRTDKRLDSFPPCSRLTPGIVRWFIFFHPISRLSLFMAFHSHTGRKTQLRPSR